MALIPAWIKKRSVVLNVFIVPGRAPLLLSKPMLKELGGKLDFDAGALELAWWGVKTQLKTNARKSHYFLDLCQGSGENFVVPKGALDLSQHKEIQVFYDLEEFDHECQERVPPKLQVEEEQEEESESPGVENLVSEPPPVTWGQAAKMENLVSEPPPVTWGQAAKTVSEPPAVTWGQAAVSEGTAGHGEDDVLAGAAVGVMPRKIRRRLEKSTRQGQITTDAVMELFSPPRVTPLAEKVGFKNLGAWDLTSGWDAAALACEKR